MTNKLVVIINSLKIPKIKKLLLHKMEFLVPNYSCLQNPWLGGYRHQFPFLCPQLNLLNPPQTKFLGTPLIEGDEWWHTHRYCLSGSMLRCLDLVPVFFCARCSSCTPSLVTTFHIVHHEFVLCSLMWTLVYIQWVTVLCKWRNYSYTFLREILSLF